MRQIKSEVRPYVYSAFIKENKQSNITPHREKNTSSWIRELLSLQRMLS